MSKSLYTFWAEQATAVLSNFHPLVVGLWDFVSFLRNTKANKRKSIKASNFSVISTVTQTEKNRKKKKKNEQNIFPSNNYNKTGALCIEAPGICVQNFWEFPVRSQPKTSRFLFFFTFISMSLLEIFILRCHLSLCIRGTFYELYYVR